MATSYSFEQLANALARQGVGGSEAVILVAIAGAESGGFQPRGVMAVNDSIGETPPSLRGVDTCASYGPWQINHCQKRDAESEVRTTAATSRDLDDHARAAVAVYRAQGFGAWTMYKNGKYRRMLDEARAAVQAADGRRTEPADGQDDAGDQDDDDAWSPTNPTGSPRQALANVRDGVGLSLLGFLGIDGRQLLYYAAGTALVVVGVALVVRETTGLGPLDVAGAAVGGPAGAAAAATEVAT